MANSLTQDQAIAVANSVAALMEDAALRGDVNNMSSAYAVGSITLLAGWLRLHGHEPEIGGADTREMWHNALEAVLDQLHSQNELQREMAILAGKKRRS